MRLAALAALCAVALATVAAPAAAQTNRPAEGQEEETFSESHLKAAARVIDLVGGDVTFDDILPRVATQTRNVLTRTNPALTREIEEAVNDVAIAMVPRRISLARDLQKIWARRFSEEELEGLAEFFSGPLGTKYVEMFPIISALSLGAAKQWEQRLSADMVNEAQARLRADGHLR